MDHIDILAAITDLIKENADLKRRLAEQTDKHWEGNRQIALYSDELRKLKEKAEPKKPVDNGGLKEDIVIGKAVFRKGTHCLQLCPTCNEWVNASRKANYCDSCGQALDWGEDNA